MTATTSNSDGADSSGEVKSPELAGLEEALGYRFSDRELLERALIHRSYANEVADEVGDNQRLEFLGDAVLGVVVAHELFLRDREVQEGALSSRQAQIVCEPALADAARRIELGRYLRLGRGEAKSGGRDKASLLADAYEALLAAIYLDGGLTEVRRVVTEQLGDDMKQVARTSEPADYKSRLQTIIQRDRDERPAYRIVDESGPPHKTVFVAEVRIGGEPAGDGSGRSKKEAEQQAAREALDALGADS
ncbi:MAG: ribonuclease III [Persicimonas sp.]